MQSEGERYPHLFEILAPAGPGKIGTALAALFARLAHKGLLQIDDFDVAARQFLALVNADLQMSTLFGVTPTEAELESAARNAVRHLSPGLWRTDAGRNACNQDGVNPGVS